jgi:hypothetical protein
VVVEHDAAARLSEGKYFHTFRSTALIYLRFLSFISARLLILLYLLRNLLTIEHTYYRASFKGLQEALATANAGKIEKVRLSRSTRKRYFFHLF